MSWVLPFFFGLIIFEANRLQSMTMMIQDAETYPSFFSSGPMMAWVKKVNSMSRRGEAFFFMVDFEGEQALALTQQECRHLGIRWSFEEVNPEVPSPLRSVKSGLDRNPVHISAYKGKFDRVMSGLRYGDSFLTNLTTATPVNSGLSLNEIYDHSKAPFKVLWPGRFVVFSPERFVQIRSGRISTYPMKGTRRDEEGKGAGDLLENLKEFEEQATVVDLLRNDISMVSRDVRVDRFRYLEAIDTDRGRIWQTSSAISGRLPVFYRENIGSIISAMLPAGSISGAPKKRTVEIIREAEGGPRGWYTGICGYFDGHDLDSAVMIRFIEQTDDGLVFRSGGGITARSVMEQEYQEMLDKVYVPIY